MLNIAKIEKIAMLDCKNKGNEDKLNNILYKIPFMKKYNNDASVDDMFEVLLKMFEKTNLGISYIFMTKGNKAGISASILDWNENADRVSTVYGAKISEIYKKAIVYIYYYAKMKNSQEENA